ncbi:MAG: inorganic phosphate transporter [Candidatus Brockarchaeota archaeon]|nr:inorganic phosphate transporter [Candidatus Brockarchaeota archaeon]
MLDLLIILGIAVYVAWSMGANNESMSILAGSGFMGTTMAAMLGAVMVLTGSLLLGHPVETTIAKGLMMLEITPMDVFIIMFPAATWLAVATFLGWPVSSTHSVVGAAIGLGLVKGGLSSINWVNLAVIMAAWVFSPLMGLFCAMLMVMLVGRIWRRSLHGLRDVTRIARKSAVLLLLCSCFTAFSRGANDVPNATAFLSTVYGDPLLIRFIGGAGMALGLMALGRRVIRTVGFNLTRLDPVAALSAQASVMLILLTGTLLGIPLSATHILIGAVTGVGLTRRVWVNIEKIREIMYAWVATFLITMLISAIIYSSTVVF